MLLPATIPAAILTRLDRDAQHLVQLATNFTQCQSPADRQYLATIHAKIGAYRRETKEMMDLCLAPILTQERKIRAPYKLTLDTLEPLEKACERTMADYDREVLRKARIEQERINAKTAEENRKRIAQAETKGTQAITKAPEIVPIVEKTVKNEDGSSSTRKTIKVWTFRGVGPDEDPAKLLGSDKRLEKLSKELMLVNVKRINELVKMGGYEEQLAAQGIEITDDFDYSSRGGK